ncbi:hypothetical protein ANO11243_075790 [Dothideomycetidae sp. 11243]|nr:hypothetical protein ANO11243_075790 [fungal sp. No.11243]
MNRFSSNIGNAKPEWCLAYDGHLGLHGRKNVDEDGLRHAALIGIVPAGRPRKHKHQQRKDAGKASEKQDQTDRDLVQRIEVETVYVGAGAPQIRRRATGEEIDESKGGLVDCIDGDGADYQPPVPRQVQLGRDDSQIEDGVGSADEHLGQQIGHDIDGRELEVVSWGELPLGSDFGACTDLISRGKSVDIALGSQDNPRCSIDDALSDEEYLGDKSQSRSDEISNCQPGTHHSDKQQPIIEPDSSDQAVSDPQPQSDAGDRDHAAHNVDRDDAAIVVVIRVEG